MLIKKYREIMQREEAHRNKWALGLTVTFSILIFVSFGFYKGYFNLGNSSPKNQVAAVFTAKSVPSPIQSTGETFSAAFKEIGDQYNKFTDSLSSVLTPFFTNIEVYERK